MRIAPAMKSTDQEDEQKNEHAYARLKNGTWAKQTARDMFYFRLGSVLEKRQERVGAEWGKRSHTAGAWKLAYEAQAA